VSDRDRPGFEEAQNFFHRPIEAYSDLYRAVLAAYGLVCAVTGLQFAEERGIHSALQVVAIRPLHLGGELSVRNFIPMVPMAADAWQRGAISAGPGLEIIAVLDRLSPDLLEAMVPSGRLLAPADPALSPAPDNLEFHRARILASPVGAA
jgi:predicted restriction endonuclease